jgi:hypothetical protein
MRDPKAPIRPVQRGELDTLLVHIVRCRDVAESAVARLTVDDFDPATELAHMVIFSVVGDFLRDHKELPSRPVMEAGLTGFAASSPELSDPQIMAGVYSIAAYCYEYKAEDLLPSYAMGVLQALLLQRRVGAYVRDLQESGGLTLDSLDEIAKRTRSSIISEGRVVQPFDDILLGAMPRIPTNVRLLDTMMGGGVRPRELYGFLAPSGGGKTTFANQLAIACARQHRHMAYFSYEEEPNAEFMVGVYACAAHVERSVIESVKRIEDLPVDARKRVEAAQEELGPYLHYIDMSLQGKSRGGAGGPIEIEASLRDLQAQGKPPFGFVVDYFWIMAMRHIENYAPAKGRQIQERIFAQGLMDELKQIAGRYSCWGWVTQQVAPAESTKKRDMKWQDASEFKSFAWNLNGCFAITVLDENGVGLLNYSKSRGTASSKQPVRLRGEYATFESLDDDIVYDQRQRKYVERDKTNAVTGDDVRGNYEGRKAGSIGI